MRYLFTIITLLIVVHAYPQMYILNEDFSGASGTTPPPGWNNIIQTGTSDDKWHFDNPGDRILSYPFTEPFAVFDADSISDNNSPEIIALESPLFDASTSNYILLYFVHYLDPGTGGSASIEAYDGSTWNEVFSYSNATISPEAEIVDLSTIVGGITNGRLRLIWSGNGSGFWAVDNIRIYASLPLDGGVVSIDNPYSPVVPGLQNVEISLGNFGYNTLTSARIDWTADNVPQTPFNWIGSIGFGQTQSNIVIGTYNFQDPVMIKVWQTLPNGQMDLNPYNDTVSEYLVAALCGSYTIGGNNPDFDSFDQVAEVLNVAGVNCPVEFIVRDGVYYEEFELRDIPGVSEINTITFRSESGDSTQAVIKIIPEALKFESMVYLNNCRYITFENLGFATGSVVSYSNNAFLLRQCSNIELKGCYFDIHNQFDAGIVMQAGCQNITIRQTWFESFSARAVAITIADESTRDISILDNGFNGATDWGYATVKISDQARKVSLEGNSLERCYRAVYLQNVDSVMIRGNSINNSNDGVYVDSDCSAIEISSNRLSNIKSHQDVPAGTSGIYVKSSAGISIFNNFIHTTSAGIVNGIALQNVTSCQICFNSVNTTNTDKQGSSRSLLISESTGILSRNNILKVLDEGIPVYISGSLAQLDLDRNNYYSGNSIIGYYNGSFYYDLMSWSSAIGMDENSLSCSPFYTSSTDLSINQALLNNTGESIAGITTDIDGTPRNPTNPDFGAKEYNKCPADAGINAVLSPENPLTGGPQDVIVLLQNQGTNSLSNVNIHWSVNGIDQTTFPWTGSLPENGNAQVTVGNFNFQPGLIYSIKTWTAQPNNLADCNPYNDTIFSTQLAVPLCGNYTIGGSNPDFTTMDDAVRLLNLAGVTCPVEFAFRDGTYYEQLVIKEIRGTSAVNTVTFRSLNNDSSKVILQIIPAALKYESMLVLDGSENVVFKDLGIYTGAQVNYFNTAIELTDVKNISFENCNFELKKESDLGIGIQKNCEDIIISQNRFVSLNPKAMVIRVDDQPNRHIYITGNAIKGATEWAVPSIKSDKELVSVEISGNLIENCYQAVYLANADSVMIRANHIKNSNEGVYIGNWCTQVEISGNRLTEMKSHQNATDGTSGINIFNVTQVSVYNNFIHTSGEGAVSGITLQNITQGKVAFNSINLTNKDLQYKSKGISLKTSSQVQVKNNIFNIKHTGTPVYISTTLNQIDFDYNDYLSYEGVIGFLNGTTYFDLPSWKTATGMDQHSLSVTPFFSSDTDPSMNQVLLNDAGTPVTGIDSDIDGTPRNPANPDLGAREYSPCAVDAGINAFTYPVPLTVGGIQEVKVILQNQGTSTLSSAKIDWEVNGAGQPQYSWSGSLAAGANTEVLLGSYDFQSANAFILKAWTALPNNTADCNPENDTILSREYSGPLCGSYTIGGTDPDFASLTKAAEVLNSAGITCPVVFLVRDGNYEEKFILGEINGASLENTITFKAENNDSSLAILKINAAAVNYEPMIKLDKSQYVSFVHLGLATGSSAGIANCAIQAEGAKHISITGCDFDIRNASDFGMLIQGGSQDILVSGNKMSCIKSDAGAINISGTQTSDIQIFDNSISGAAAWGNTLVRAGNSTKKIEISGNQIERSFRAMHFIGADSIDVLNNEIKNSNSGIYIDNLCTHFNIEGNYLVNIMSIQTQPDGTNGIFAQFSSKLDIINNFIETGGVGPVLGINLQNITSCRTYYNSVNITNTDAQGKSKGIYLRTVDSLQARNNIFNVKTIGTPIHIDLNVSHLTIDYNDYYNPSGLIGRLISTDYNNLFTWGETINGDANSKSVNPYFKADTIPLPYQRILNGSGIPIAGIIFDIEGKLRHIQAPDIGCVEFFVDYGVLELLSPDLNCYRPEVDSVKVYLRQFGDVPFENLKVAYQLDAGAIHIDTIPGPLMYDIVHTFSTTETISTPGDYMFRVWLINTLDDNINNDTLWAERFSKPAPVISIEYDNLCTGWEVHFTGNATVEEPYQIAQYEWLFGDGDTAYVQDPIHVYNEAGTYEVTLRVYSDAGCYSEEFVPVTVTPDFQGLELDYTVGNQTCQDDGSGTLEFFPQGGTPPYKYYLNGQETGSFVSNFLTGKYEIKVEDANGCTKTDSVECVTLVKLNPQIIADPLSGYTPLTVNFDFTATDPASWVWHFETDLSDTNKVTSFTFTEYGNHEVILGVNSGPPYYCTETTTVTIFVDIIITIEPNSVFTPNDDGHNDYFEVKSVGLKEMNVKIFNQWGNKVYEITEIDGKWDGTTSDGVEAADGTYYYSLNAVGINDISYDRKGSVLLLRHGAAAFPNPVTDHVVVEPYESLEGPLTVTVYSVYGQLSHSEIIEDPANITLNLESLESGTYIVKVSDGKKDCYARIIKK